MNHDNLDQFQGFDSLTLDITDPLKFSGTLAYNNLSLICGANGAGKSFSNKLTWVNNFFFNALLVAKKEEIELMPGSNQSEILQWMLDATFIDQHFIGSVSMEATDKITDVPHYFLEYSLLDGKVLDLKIDYPTKAVPMGPIIYLSKEVRSFSSIENYLRTREMVGGSQISSLEDMGRLVEFFPLFDIVGHESLLLKFEKMPELLKIVNSVDSSLLDGLDIKSIYIEDKKILYTDSKGISRRTVSLSSGHQAILIMLLTSVS